MPAKLSRSQLRPKELGQDLGFTVGHMVVEGFQTRQRIRGGRGPPSRVPPPVAALARVPCWGALERQCSLQSRLWENLPISKNILCAGCAQPCAWHRGEDQSQPANLGRGAGEIRREGQAPTLTEGCMPGTTRHFHALPPLILLRVKGSDCLISSLQRRKQRLRELQ